jgi:hypothetical protein
VLRLYTEFRSPVAACIKHKVLAAFAMAGDQWQYHVVVYTTNYTTAYNPQQQQQ